MVFWMLKHRWAVIVMVVSAVIMVPLTIFSAPYPDPLIKDSEFAVRYDSSGNPVINYRLAQFAAKLASQVYTDTGNSDFAPEEVPAIGNSLYDSNLEKQTTSLQLNGFKKENIWLVNHYNDPAVTIKRQQYVDTWEAKAALLGAAITDRTVRMSDENMQLIANASLQAILAKKQIIFNGVKRNLWVIVFRGTEGLKPNGVIDWECNLSASEEPFNPVSDNIKVHRGFFASVRAFETANAGRDTVSIEDKIKTERRPEDIFLVVGHSLGGANATLFGAKLISPKYYGIPRDNVQVYTFGAPSVGNADFRNIFNGETSNALRLNLQRIRHKYDFVPYSSYLSSIADDSGSFAENMLMGGSPGAVFLATTATRLLANSMEKFPFVHIGMVHTFDTDPIIQELSGSNEERFAGYDPFDWFKITGELKNGTPNHNMANYYNLTHWGAIEQQQSDITVPVITITPNDNTDYTTPIEITATMNKAGTIHCTPDGTEPVFNSNNVDIFKKRIDKSTTIKCFAVDQAGNTSTIKTKFFSVHYIDPASQTPYLEIQVPTTVRNTVSQNNTIRLTPADKIRLYPRNDTGWPDFKMLTGTVTVWLHDMNDKSYAVPGTLLSDGGVEFSITVDMPADSYYSVIATYSNDGGQKHLAPEYSVQQVVEIANATNNSDSATIRPKDMPVPRFIDNNNGTVTDKLTGLLWTKDADCYGFITWQQSLDFAKQLSDGHCGLNDGSQPGDWRLPNFNELRSIVEYDELLVLRDGSLFSPAIQKNYFSYLQYKTGDDYYWSSTSSADSSYRAYTVHFGGGVDYRWDKGLKNHFWAVRDANTTGAMQLSQTNQSKCYNALGKIILCSGTGQDADIKAGLQAPQPRFVDSPNGTTFDRSTGLIWYKNSSCFDGGYNISYDQALTDVSNFKTGQCQLNDGSAAGDWRIPTIFELQSMLDFNYTSIAPYGFQLWSSTPYPGYDVVGAKFYLNGYYGSVDGIVADFAKIYPVRNKRNNETISIPGQSQIVYLSENLPDGSYHVGAATKTWRFKNGTNAITGLKAVQVSADSGLGISQTEILIGNVAANTDLLVNLPINPIHDSTALKSSYWKLTDATGAAVTITNSASGQFWMKIKTNHSPVFSQLQLVSVAGSANSQISHPILAFDPDSDSLTYSVVSGGGSVVDGTWQGKPAKLYQNTFTTPGVQAVTIQVDDGHGETAQYTIQAVITSDGKIANFFSDVPYPTDPISNKQQYDQYLAIHYLALNGIVIGYPDPNNATARVFEGGNIAKQAEALAMVMKAASLRNILALDAEQRYLPNLIKVDVANGVYENFSWATPYVLKAEELGLIDNAETFDPSALATRAWLATIVSRMLELDPPLDALSTVNYVFADVADFPSTDDYDNARAMAFFGYMGKFGSSTFNPRENMIRADVAVVTARILQAPMLDGITTVGLTAHSLYGRSLPSITHGQSFTVTGLTNLQGHSLIDTNGSLSENRIDSPQDYVKVMLIRLDSGIVAQDVLAKNMATAPATVPTGMPDISASEARDLLVLVEDTTSGVRNIFHMEYGVIFPDSDGDGVRDELDQWPTNPLFFESSSGNGIPDNANALWGLSAKTGTDIVVIGGVSMTLLDAVLSGKYAQLVSDTAAPELSLSTLPNGSITNNTTLNVAGTVSDSISGVKGLTVNGQAATVAGDGTFSVSVTLVDGTNSIITIATDNANNTATDTRTITLDRTAPALTITLPADNSVTGKTFAEISGSVDDPNATVTAKVNSDTATTAVMSGTNFIATLHLTSGLNTVYITATDLAGNITNAKRSITSDTTVPTLAITNPAQDSTTTQNSITISGTVTEVVTSATISIAVNGQTYVPVVATDGSFSQAIDLPTENTYSIIVTATDQAGNIAKAQRNIVYKVAQQTVLKGDINNDGKVDVADALLALQYALNLIPHNTTNDAVYLVTADVAPVNMVIMKPSGDGKIDIMDALVILQRSVNLLSW